MMIVSKLLKSCATPPVNCPMPSIFCACRARSSAARRSVRSRVILAKPKSSSSGDLIALMTTPAQNVLPSLRTRQPSASYLPDVAAIASAFAGISFATLIRRIKRRKMAPDDFIARISLDPLGSRIPVHHMTLRIQHIDRVIGDAFDQQPEAALGILKSRLTGGELNRALFGPLFERLVQLLKLLLRLPAGHDFLLVGLMETRIIDRDGRLSCKPRDDLFGPIGKDMRLRVPKEKAAQNFAGSRNNRHRQIASDRQMAFRHALVRRVLAISRVGQNVIGTYGTASPECRLEDGRVARHREFGEGFPRNARQRVESVGLAVLPHDVIEKGPELGVAQLHAGIRHGLNQCRKITFGSNSDARVVEDFKASSLLPEFCNARFQRLIEGQQTNFQSLASVIS